MNEIDIIWLAVISVLYYSYYKVISWIDPSSDKAKSKGPSSVGEDRPRSSSFTGSHCNFSHAHSPPHRRFSVDFAPQSMSTTPFRSRSQSSKDIIKIAVDASPKRAAGLLVLPKQKLVFFYSIEWGHMFDFRCEPDKFEMVNALLALQIFKEYITPYRKFYENALLLKADNNLCVRPDTIYSRQRNANWSRLFQDIHSVLKSDPFGGEWDYTCKHKDVYLRIADKLTRGDHFTSKILPGLEFKNVSYPRPFEKYKQENVSREDKWMLYPTRRHLQWLDIHDILA